MILFINKKRGIGLVEAIAAIGILITGIISVVTLAQSNLTYSQGVGSRMIAINLAREGFEAVRSIRDSNWLKGCTAPSGSNITCELNPSSPPTELASWDYGMTGIDATAVPILNLSDFTWSLKFEDANSFTDPLTKLGRFKGSQGTNVYHQPSSVADDLGTNFRRLLEIYAICYEYNPDGSIGNKIEDNDAIACGTNFKAGIRVVSKVQWQEKGRSQSVAVEGLLYNWRFSYTPYEP